MKTSKTREMTRDNWLKAALSALVEGGVAAVRVEPLAVRLGVTKGSFYWHFRDRPALLSALLDYWEANFTRGLIEEVSALPDPAERLRAMARMALAHSLVGLDNARAEMAMQAWAAQDEMAAARQREIDRTRLAYLEADLRSLGIDAGRAALYAQAIYHALLGLYAARVYHAEIASDDAFLALIDLIIAEADRGCSTKSAPV